MNQEEKELPNAYTIDLYEMLIKERKDEIKVIQNTVDELERKLKEARSQIREK